MNKNDFLQYIKDFKPAFFKSEIVLYDKTKDLYSLRSSYLPFGFIKIGAKITKIMPFCKKTHQKLQSVIAQANDAVAQFGLKKDKRYLTAKNLQNRDINIVNAENSLLSSVSETDSLAANTIDYVNQDSDINFDDKTVAPNVPRIIFIVGGSGAGKSTLAEQLIKKNKDKRKYHLVDTDKIRDNLPEYQDFLKQEKNTDSKKIFAKIHNKARNIKDEMLYKCLKNKLNVVYPTPGGSFLQRMIDQFKQNGFYVKVFFVEANADTASQRATLREQQTGRHTPDELVKNTSLSSKSYFETQWSKQAHTARHYDNTEVMKKLSKKKHQWDDLPTQPKPKK